MARGKRSVAFPPGRPPGFSQDDQRRMQDEMAADEAQARERHFRYVGAIKRHGIYDSGCPKCGQATIGKVHCPGRERDERDPVALQCYILGDHLHAQCGTCKFVWIERCKDDDLDMDARGGKRADEMIVDGQVHAIELPSAAAIWGIEPAER